MKNKFTKGMLVLIISFLAFQINAQTTNDGHNGNKPEKSPITNTYNDLNKGSKSVLFSDDFSDGITNWTTMNAGAENWSGNDSDIAGGTAPEAFLNSTPVFEGYSTLMSPIINTTGEAALALTLTQTLDNNVGDFSIKIQTTIDGGESWNTPWVKYVTDGDDYSFLENIIIQNTHVGSENFQFAFRFKGVSDKMNGWYIDDVELSGVTVLDVSPISIGGIPDEINPEDPIVISSVVENLGYATVTFDVQLEISDDDGIVFFSSKTVSDLATTEQVSVEFNEWTALEGDFTATVTTLLGDDSNTENDVISDNFTVISPVTYCIPGGDCSNDDGITGFVFSGIDNDNSGCSPDGYGDFTNMQATTEIGQTYTVSIKTGYSNNNASIWVDWNKDLIFSQSELLVTDHPLVENEFVDIEVTIPGFFQPGLTYMRVAAVSGENSSDDPCAVVEYGEFEDYAIEITGNIIENDVTPLSINVQPIIELGDITPTVTVYNNGSSTATFPITLTINDGYSSTVTVTDLGFGETTEVTFDTWTVAALGEWELTATTNLANDENTDNDSQTTIVNVITAVSNIDKLNNIKMYPNPSQNYITLSNLDDVNIFIYDMSGTLINEYQHINNKITINTINYTNGTYLVKVVSNNTVLTTKLNIVK